MRTPPRAVEHTAATRQTRLRQVWGGWQQRSAATQGKREHVLSWGGVSSSKEPWEPCSSGHTHRAWPHEAKEAAGPPMSGNLGHAELDGEHMLVLWEGWVSHGLLMSTQPGSGLHAPPVSVYVAAPLAGAGLLE